MFLENSGRAPICPVAPTLDTGLPTTAINRKRGAMQRDVKTKFYRTFCKIWNCYRETPSVLLLAVILKAYVDTKHNTYEHDPSWELEFAYKDCDAQQNGSSIWGPVYLQVINPGKIIIACFKDFRFADFTGSQATAEKQTRSKCSIRLFHHNFHPQLTQKIFDLKKKIGTKPAKGNVVIFPKIAFQKICLWVKEPLVHEIENRYFEVVPRQK